MLEWRSVECGVARSVWGNIALWGETLLRVGKRVQDVRCVHRVNRCMVEGTTRGYMDV